MVFSSHFSDKWVSTSTVWTLSICENISKIHHLCYQSDFIQLLFLLVKVLVLLSVLVSCPAINDSLLIEKKAK